MHRSWAPRHFLLTVLGALLVAGSTAPAASAGASRYASPGGSGAACASASPCSIATAVAGAAKGDEVIVAPGDYHLKATIVTPPLITVHGAAGKPRPRLLFSGVGQEGVRVVS